MKGSLEYGQALFHLMRTLPVFCNFLNFFKYHKALLYTIEQQI